MQTAVIDLSRTGVTPVFHAMQGDTKRLVQLRITDGGVPRDVSGDAVSIWYTGPSGAGNYSDGVTKSGDTLTLPIHPGLTAAPGRYQLSAMLNDTAGKCSTWTMMLDVSATPGYGSAEAKAYFEAFEAGSLQAQLDAIGTISAEDLQTLWR